ncbi:MAG TPA: sigma-70 family RNA polymerase sigma factor [Puia sp.]|nr:sigma-70 family RNA polymerase sigma factor [Puia sp.]
MSHESLDPGSLLDSYWRRLQFFAFTLLDDMDLAKDAVADVFIRLHKNKELLAGAEDVQRYLYGSVRNACYNVLRKKLIPVVQADPTALEDLSAVQEKWASEHQHNVIRAEMREQLVDLIMALPAQQQEIITRRYLKNEKILDIADKMGLSEYQVRTYGEKAINQMKINALKVDNLQGLLLLILLGDLF